jgi:hypothetical protein
MPMLENPAGLVYGTILIATLLSAEYSRRETYLTTGGAVVVALALYWLALAYSEFTGRRIKDTEHFTFSAFWHAAEHEISVLLGAVVPIGVLVICSILDVELGTAVEIAVYSAAGLVVVYELLIGYWSEARGRELVLHTIVGICLGLLIVTLRVVLH